MAVGELSTSLIVSETCSFEPVMWLTPASPESGWWFCMGWRKKGFTVLVLYALE